MKFSRNLSEKELAEHKDQSITLRTTKSYYLTGKVHRCELVERSRPAKWKSLHSRLSRRTYGQNNLVLRNKTAPVATTWP